MRKYGTTFNGTAATVYLCIGFVPDAVRLLETDLNSWAEVYWDKTFRAGADAPEGYSVTALDTVNAYRTLGTGIQPYYGGETLTTTTAGDSTYGEGVYLKRDDNDYRYLNSNKVTGDASTVDISDWTLDNSTTYAGHFNGNVTGTYIGKGSTIFIYAGGRIYRTFIVSVTAAHGAAASEVVLGYPVPTGKVVYIGGMYGLKPMAAGEVTKAGIKCFYSFTNNNIVSFTAEEWD